MKRELLISVLLCAALLCACGGAAKITEPQPTASPTAVQTTAPTATPTAMPTPTKAPEIQTGEEAQPMQPEEKYAGVQLAANVTPQMLEPDFWLQSDPQADTVLMTAEEIAAFNAQTIAQLAPYDRMFDIYTAADTVPGERVRALLAADPAAPAGDCVNGQAMPQGYLQALEANRSLDTVPETVCLRYGVMADRANARTQPTADMLSGGGDKFFDDVQQAELYWNEPVLILHESADGEWYYILSRRMDGWVQKCAVALFDAREEWLAWQQQADVLVVTANRMRLDYNTACAELSCRELAMGTCLPLAAQGEAPQTITGRTPIGNYIVKVPLRGEDGGVIFEYAAIPISADVSRGYLPYTRRGVLHQLFKMQGTNYGWGGTQAANDCSGITVQVYRCFGLELARNSKSLYMLPCKTVELSEFSLAERGAALAQTPAGSILYFPGHIMLYLGEYDNRYYVMSATGAVDLYGTGQQNRVLTVLLNDLGVKNKKGVSWLEQMKAIKIICQPE